MSFLTVSNLAKNKQMKIILTTTFLLILILGCKKEVTHFTSIDVPSNLVLEKAEITSFLKNHPENETIQNSVLLFYKNRNYSYAWFNQDGMTEAVLNFQNQLQNYSYDFQDNSLKDNELSKLIASKNQTETNSQKKKTLELLLTTTYFKYARKAYGGITKTAHELDWYIPRKKKNYQVMLDSLIKNDENNITKPVNPYYSNLLKKLHSYRDIQKKGGFPIIETDRKLLSIHDKDSCLIQLKQRLYLSGDLKINDGSILFTKDLDKAVNDFQERLGLTMNGKLNTKTIIELNKTVEYRIKQILVNLERLRWIPDTIENDYLLVNIPEYKLHIIKNGKLLWETNVIVGKEAKRTSVFRGNIARIILNPYWNIPNSIINEEVLPKLKRNSNYLSKNNMEVVSSSGKPIDASTINWNKYTENIPYLIRQKPGNENSLGKMKFLFPNNFNIYLHDTPAKELFNQRHRDFSHGCIRVENPKKLALYLLQKNTNWNGEKIDKVLETITETGIAIKPKMPVYIVYFTAWVDDKNNLNFRNDIYNLDEQLAKNIFEEN
jgi:murein L,D-transpeptidase YcbB/YkuD